MHSIRRSCQTALQSSNAICPFANVSRRAFSRSSAHQRGALPVFLEPSTPELSTLLSTLNSKVLLPYHLTRDQQKLVYKQENRAKIESEPIEISLGDVTLPLEHIDRNRDMPSRWKQLREIIRQSKSQADWENVLRIMEGFENAGMNVKAQWQEMIVRKLNEAGMQHLVLKALQRAGKTGFRLRKWEVIVEVLRAMRDKAAKSDWDKEELKKALSMAEQVVELMENKEHLSKAEEEDYRTHPAVIAVPLEMAAELAYRHDGDMQKVKKYALRLMNALKQHNFLESELEAHSTLAAKRDYKTANEQASGLTSVARAMYSMVPVWNSLSTTRTVLDEGMPMANEAEQTQQRIRKALATWQDAVEELRVRDGKEIGSGYGYVGYVKAAIKRCEEDADE